MSKVDENTKPDWAKEKEGLVFFDSRCCTCSCCNSHGSILDEMGSNWGTFTKEDDTEYVVYQMKEFLPTSFLVGLCPCFFLHFALMSCIPMTEALVIGYNRKKNETFAEVRVKSFCSGWTVQSRKRLSEVTMTFSSGGLLTSASASVNIFSDDNRPPLKIPLKVTSNDTRGGCKGDVEGFVRACNDLLEKTRGAGAGAGGAIATAVVYAPYGQGDTAQMATAVPVSDSSAPPDYDSIGKGDR